MIAPRAIPEALRRTQVEASDPAVSAWVTANAGSGKTHVLAQRVIRLLLEGVAGPRSTTPSSTRRSGGFRISNRTRCGAPWRGGYSPWRWRRRAD
jgi:UvrD/REP helicase N-terminal domain